MSIASAAILAVAGPAVAQTQVQPQPQPAFKAPTNADPVICVKEEETGSRLGAQKVCHTRSQWEELRAGDRSATERAQSQRAMAGDPH